MKYQIEKNTVQETLVIPLYARKKAVEIFPALYKDDIAAKIIEQIDYDFSSVEKTSGKAIYLRIFGSGNAPERPCVGSQRLS